MISCFAQVRPLLGDSNRLVEQLAVLAHSLTQHLMNVLLKDYLVSLGFSMTDMKTNKISNSTDKVIRKWKESVTLFK